MENKKIDKNNKTQLVLGIHQVMVLK